MVDITSRSLMNYICEHLVCEKSNRKRQDKTESSLTHEAFIFKVGLWCWISESIRQSV